MTVIQRVYKVSNSTGRSVLWTHPSRTFGCSIEITMIRLTLSLLVGLAAVSTLPLDETTTEQLPPQTTTKTITLEDVENDEGIEAIRASLSICSMENPASRVSRNIWENALKEVMESKNFSAFFDEFLKNITATRKAECLPGSDPNQFTGRNSGNYVMLASVTFNGPETRQSSENNEELSAVQGTEELQQCHLETNLHDSCELGCVKPSHMECVNAKWQCESNYFEEDGKCLPGFGASCHDDTGCAQKNLTCLQRTCGCDGHYSPLSEICRKWPTELNDFCHEALPCDRIENSYCRFPNCVCKEHYVEQNGRCVAGLGAPCKNATECSAVPNLTCVAEKCALH